MAENRTKIAEALEISLSAMEQRGWSVEDCLAQYPADQAELGPLLRAAEQYRMAHNLVPSEAFRQRAAARLSTRLRQLPRRAEKVSPRTRLFNLPRRFATALIAALIVIGLAGATSGTIYAAEESLPGDPLYPVGQTVEQAQLAFSPPGNAFGLRLKFAEKRLKEAEKLRERGDDALMQQALDAYGQLVSDATLLLDSAGAPSDPVELEDANTQLSSQQTRLQALLDQVPESARAGISRAIDASKQGQERATLAIKKNGGGGSKNCGNGTSLTGHANGQAHKLAAQYDVPFEAIRDLLCEGLTLEQVEERLASATPSP
jgi:uncharacterized protein DUF5667